MNSIQSSETTPKSLGYRLPAEWEPHSATWLAWPHNEDDWPGHFEPIPGVFVEIIKSLHRVETVHILVNDEAAQQRVASKLERAGVSGHSIRFHQIPTNRVWTRDYGPILIKDAEGTVAATNWKFNAWAKYDDWQLDDAAAESMVNALEMRQWRPMWNGQPIVMEGGSIDCNGAGTLLTTEECLLSPIQARNPGLTKTDLEQVFSDYFGIRKTLWLQRGIVGDDTHGHVDDIARFVNNETVVCVVENDQGDDNYEPTNENLSLLRSMTNADGQQLEVIPLPMPGPIYLDGQRLPASYANFYVANELVLVPTFNDSKDRLALSTMSDLFPHRQVVKIDCGDLIRGLGAIHCMTQQQPV